MRVINIRQRGFTLVEVLVAVALLGAIFVTIFELNARCLRFIDASKERKQLEHFKECKIALSGCVICCSPI